MAKPVPTPGVGCGHGALQATIYSGACARGGSLLCLGRAAAGLLICFCFCSLLQAQDGTKLTEGGAHRRAISDEEITALWEGRPVRSSVHRGYIYIDEEDIVEGTELPLYTIEASRYGVLRRLERMTDGDAGLSARIADLAPELARETEMRRREDAAFYSRRSCAARRDTPQTPDVLVGPLMSLINQRR